MELVNVFENDAFTIASMSDGIQQAPTQPRELSENGLFVPEGQRSNVIAIEYRNGKLEIADIDDRGDVISTSNDDDRLIKHVRTKRVSRHCRINASELQFVNQINDLNHAVTSVQEEIARRQMGPTGLMSQCENRLELMRLGALQGKVVDQNGNTIWDFYNEFDITEPPAINISLSTLKDGALRKKLEQTVVRPLRRMAKGLVYSRIDAKCGEEFWDELMANPEFYNTYNEQAKGEERRGSTIGTTVLFAGIHWAEYIGADDGSSINLPAGECRVYPGGASGMFRHAMSPGESFSDLGQLGKDWYSYQVMDPTGLQRFVDLYVMTYPGMINTRPDLVFKLTHS